MTTEVQLSTFIETELQKFEVSPESLKALVEPVKGLTIASLEDRDNYVKVRESRLMLKSKRVEIEKSGKALRENAIKFQRAVIAREKELIDIIEPEEQRLKNEESKFEEWKEQQRIEAERRESERIQARINHLAQFNYAIDFYEAKTMPDEEFAALLANAQDEYNAELQRIEARKAEEERLRQAEAERIRKEREELERIQAELKVERERIAAEQERIRKAQEAKEAELRAEQARLESERRRMELEEAKRKAAEQQRIKAEELARIAEQERIALEARQKALKPFKEKMTDFADRLNNLRLEIPVSTDETSAALHDEVANLLEKLSNHIKTRINDL